MNALLDFANEYYTSKLNSEAWDNLTDTLKEKWLAEATRQVLSVEGIRLPQSIFNVDTLDGVNLSQAEILFFQSVIDGNSTVENVDSDIATAICEVCLEMLNSSDNETFSKLQRAGVTSINYGNDSVSFNTSSATSKTSDSYVNDYAYSLLQPYIKRSFRVV